MELAQAGPFLYLSFNQDYSCFSLGTENGFCIFDVHPLKERFRRDFTDGGFGIVEMRLRSNMLALVGGGLKPKYPKNKVMIWDDIQASCVAELEFRTTVRGVRMRKDRIVVVLENIVFVYTFGELKLIHHIDTYSNPAGLCAVSTGAEIVIATLGEKVGEVRVEHYSRRQTKVITAHNNTIQMMCLDPSGLQLATASSRGTLIRVFDTITGSQLKEFRRGSSGAQIQSLAFNNNGTALVCSSDTGTIHIFSNDAEFDNRSSTFSLLSTVVPILGSSWSTKEFKVPEKLSICAFGPEENGQHSVIVLGASGRYYRYSFQGKGPNGNGSCVEEAVENFLSVAPTTVGLIQ